MKYPYTLYEKSSILLTDIGLSGLPPELEFEGQRLYIKDEFHITLISARFLAGMIDPDNPEQVVDQIVQEVDEFTATTPLDTYELSHDLRFVQTGDQKTIILMASVPNIDKLFARLSQKFSMGLPQQQTHVTLYRYPKDFIGIPIPSPEILANISRSIEAPELTSLI